MTFFFFSNNFFFFFLTHLHHISPTIFKPLFPPHSPQHTPPVNRITPLIPTLKPQQITNLCHQSITTHSPTHLLTHSYPTHHFTHTPPTFHPLTHPPTLHPLTHSSTHTPLTHTPPIHPQSELSDLQEKYSHSMSDNARLDIEKQGLKSRLDHLLDQLDDLNENNIDLNHRLNHKKKVLS